MWKNGEADWSKGNSGEYYIGIFPRGVEAGSHKSGVYWAGRRIRTCRQWD